MAETGVLNRVFIAAESTTAITEVSAGSNIDHTAITSTWTTIGSVDESDDLSLGSGALDMTRLEEISKFKAPRQQAYDANVVLGNGYDTFTCPVYGYNATVLALDGMNSTSSAISKPGTTKTYKAVIAEIDGKGYFYFPKCLISVKPKGAAVDGVIEADLVCQCFSTTAVKPAGEWHQYS